MAIVYTKTDQGLTVATGTGAPVHTAVAGDRYTDTANGNTYQYTTSWQTISYSAGGLTYFTETQNTTAPNATVPVDSLTAVTATTNGDIAIVPKGTGAFTLAVADNLASGGNKRGTNAIDLQTIRSVNTQVASGVSSFLAGNGSTASGSFSVALGNGNTASNTGSVSLGQSNNVTGISGFAAGSNNTNAGPYSAIFGFSNTISGVGYTFKSGYGNTGNAAYSITTGYNNAVSGSENGCFGSSSTVSADNAFSLGYQNLASGLQSFAIGKSCTASNTGTVALGNTNTSSGNLSYTFGSSCTASNANAIAMGNRAKATGDSAICLASYFFADSTASGANSTLIGYGSAGGTYALGLGFSVTAGGAQATAIGYSANTFSTIGRVAIGGVAGGTGEAQKGIIQYRQLTTDATPTILTTNNAVAFNDNAGSQLALRNQQVMRFKGSITAKQSGTTDIAIWDIDGVLVRGANAASTVLTVGNVNVVTNIPAWVTPTLAANTSVNVGGLLITITGVIATNIQWFAAIDTVENIYL